MDSIDTIDMIDTVGYGMIRSVSKLNAHVSLVRKLPKNAKRIINVLYIIIKRIAPLPTPLENNINKPIQEGE